MNIKTIKDNMTINILDFYKEISLHNRIIIDTLFLKYKLYSMDYKIQIKENSFYGKNFTKDNPFYNATKSEYCITTYLYDKQTNEGYCNHLCSYVYDQSISYEDNIKKHKAEYESELENIILRYITEKSSI